MTHILDINEVWYSSFWSEGPKNLKILISKFVPWDLEGCHTDLVGRLHRTLRGGTMGPRGSRCDTPRGPRETNFETKIFSLGGFRPLRPNQAIPHPNTIQNMRLGHRFFWNDLFDSSKKYLSQSSV